MLARVHAPYVLGTVDTHSPFSVHTYRSRYRLFYPCGTFPYTPAAPLGVATPGIERDIDVTSLPAPPLARPHQAPRPQGRRNGARHPAAYRPYGFFASTIVLLPIFHEHCHFPSTILPRMESWIVESWTVIRGIIYSGMGIGDRKGEGVCFVHELCNFSFFFFLSIFSTIS